MKKKNLWQMLPPVPQEHIEALRDLEWCWENRNRNVHEGAFTEKDWKETADLWNRYLHPDARGDSVVTVKWDQMIKEMQAKPGRWAVLRYHQLLTYPELPPDARMRAVSMAERSFSWVSYLLPSRLRNELVGDAMEEIHRIVDDPACPNIHKAVMLKVISTCFFLLINAVRNVSSAIMGKKAE